MPGRLYNSANYRYGFNGKENDNEIKGTGNQQDYGMRIYDGRLGKFLSVDPLYKDFAWNSTYAFAENDVIRSIDLDGEEKYVVTQKRDETGKIIKMSIYCVKSTKIDGQIIDQQLTINKVSYAGSEIIVRNVDSKGNLISVSKQDKFNRIQQKLVDEKGKKSKIRNEDNTAHLKADDSGNKVIEDAYVETSESDLTSTSFVYTSPAGNTELSSIKDNAKAINTGSEYMSGESKKKQIDEIQFEGSKSSVMKKNYSPHLSKETKSKENTAGVPKNGMTGLRLTNYDLKK
jgi:RHS repeat-associated protein